MTARSLCFFLRSLLLALLAATFGGLAPMAAQAAGEQATVYAGTIGKAEVVMEVESFDGGVSGRYFYRKHRLDIPLSGEWKQGELALQSRETGDRLQLRRSPAGLTGSLFTRNGTQVAVSLSLAAEPVERNPAFAPDLSAYERHQLAGLRLAPGKTATLNGRVIRDYREAVSGISLFRIESGYAPAAMARINAALERQHWQEISNWFGCPGFDGEPGMDVSAAQTPWLGDDHVSYAWSASWTCAGTAHPDFGTEGHSFDAHTGAELALDDLLRFGDNPPPSRESDGFFAYRSDVFAPAVLALLRRLYPEQLPAGESDDGGCDYTDPDVWNFPSWYLTEQGVYLGAIFPRVNRSCDNPDWSIIPWRELPRRAALPAITGDHLALGEARFFGRDIKNLSIAFDHGGFAVLDIAFTPQAAELLKAETLRLQNSDIAIMLGERQLTMARLVEPIVEGLLRISGHFSLVEIQTMGRDIACGLKLTDQQFANRDGCGKASGTQRR